MTERLTGEELVRLVRRVFEPGHNDRALAVLADLPDALLADHPAWRERRETALEWVEALRAERSRLGLETDLVVYRNARRNNADLPNIAWLHSGGPLPSSADDLDPASSMPFDELFRTRSILIAPTELSATAPLKLAARRHGFRAATMPGFSAAMIPALRLDYGEVNRRVQLLKGLLDRASAAGIRFAVDGAVEEHRLTLDLRHRTAHASGGLLREPGTAGNLPSGEAYIVPYEGELDGEPTGTAGTLPVELEGEVVLYRIEANRATAVVSSGPVSEREAAHLAAEPAYGNLAELGLGVLADFGIEPIGEVLLDEKLGLHIAFGRSDHFGGQVGAKDFSRPEAVIHQDRVYIPQLQPRVAVAEATLTMEGGKKLPLMRDGAYSIDFGR